MIDDPSLARLHREHGARVRLLPGEKAVDFPEDLKSALAKIAADNEQREAARQRAIDYGTIAMPLIGGQRNAYAVTSHTEHPGCMYVTVLTADGGPGWCACAASVKWCTHTERAVTAWEEGRRA